MANTARPPAGPPPPYMPFSPQTPPPAKKQRSIVDLIKLVLMAIGGLVVVCAGFGAVLKSTGYVSPTSATQTVMVAQAPAGIAGLSGSVGGKSVEAAVQASPVPSTLPSALPATAAPPTATPAGAAIAYEPMDLGQWEVVLAEVETASVLGGDPGTWLIVHGTITNEGTSHLIGKQELQLRAGSQTLELNRSASKVVAERYGLTNIAQVGGTRLDGGESIEWAIVFDVPSVSDNLTFMVDGQAGVKLGDVITLAGLPTLTPAPTWAPAPTATQRPPTEVSPTVTPTPNHTISVGAAVNVRSGPNAAFDKVRTLDAAEPVTFVAKKIFQDVLWYQIRTSQSEIGWISSEVAAIDGALVSSLPVSTQSFVLPTPVPQQTARPAAQPAPSANSGQRIGAICRDGTRSSATGRGACSHHGGVDHWILAP